ncbi:glycosyltransferase family 2 protein [Piscinibacter koreensis]|uniref:Glycosyltransferase family 2 protein n=1 Tax=Piscinibacter koreensis TaxID=2742824 RepID=A0A7Y6NRV2_9BURK|nr:glycosyltransferase family 2 protein [Schlegelella koreensis]NUZ08185.1 glycosyltransferase family 2 protein [Schlegelella koreensis]
MLSVLIPSYNHASYIEQAIDSARRISVPGKRIVIIDDASTDETAAVIEENLRRHGAEGIDFIRKPQNRGAIDSVLTFLAMCRTEYVYFMASDDIAIGDGVGRLVAMLEARNSLQFVIGGGSNLLPDGTTTPLYGRKHARLFGHPPEALVEALFLTDPSPLLCQSSVFRLRAIEAVNGFDPALVADDFTLFTRLFKRFHHRGVDFEFAPEVDCVRYRHHGSNSYRNLPRQASSHRQVILANSPERLRTKAAGYKLAFFALVAAKRRDRRSLLQIARMTTLSESPWFVIGLFANAINWLRLR